MEDSGRGKEAGREPALKQLDDVIDRIRGIRNRKSVSQQELSERASLSQSFLASIETGKKRPSALTIIKIANALDVSPRVFFPDSPAVWTKDEVKKEIISLLNAL
jgi:transcriptional regulator with XRE-family HTH domain